jgi:hypothetical protein
MTDTGKSLNGKPRLDVGRIAIFGLHFAKSGPTAASNQLLFNRAPFRWRAGAAKTQSPAFCCHLTRGSLATSPEMPRGLVDAFFARYFGGKIDANLTYLMPFCNPATYESVANDSTPRKSLAAKRGGGAIGCSQDHAID